MLPMNGSRRLAAILAVTLLWGGCRSTRLPVVPRVDLERFMGNWYVIANIPTPFEKNAFNTVETYSQNPDGTIATTFTFREGGFDGKERSYHPKGFVEDDGSNAVWGMRFGPIKAEYLIVSLNEDYTQAVVARNKRDFVWIMARTPTIPDEDYARLIEQIGKWGYDTEKIRLVPQRW